jgi:AcrR family transcriptional regulator
MIFVSNVSFLIIFASRMEEKALHILEKSADVFMRFGVKAVTMDDLARELGVSKKTIYKYFPDKKELVKQIVLMKTELDKVLCKTAQENSDNAIDELFMMSQFVQEMFGDVHTSVFFDLQKYYKEAWDIMEEHKNSYVRNLIKANIIRGINEGLFREDLKPEIIATAYFSALNGVFDGVSFASTSYSLSEIFIEIIRFQIRGLASEKGLDYLKKKIKTIEK